ncbi:LIM domain-containing protein 1 isoform X1 [Nothobranchius furzeri]|uniref:LIM domain-containing protein 1 isoform X1 n=1 Tax=Nothobranchius furzeri TaxID=105023 RepID=UPI003904C216
MSLINMADSSPAVCVTRPPQVCQTALGDGNEGKLDMTDPSYTPSLYFRLCTRCGEAVNAAGGACQAMGHVFHRACFTCSMCNKQLHGKPFFTASGLIYCEEDFLVSMHFLFFRLKRFLFAFCDFLEIFLKFSGVHPSREVCNSCRNSITDLTAAGGSALRCRLSLQDLLCQRLSEDQGSPL